MKKKSVLGVVGGAVLGAALLLSIGASGDLIYISPERTQVDATAAQAVTLADAFIAIGAWDGHRSDMSMCVIERNGASATGFLAYCRGRHRAAPGSVSFADGPITVIGVEP